MKGLEAGKASDYLPLDPGTYTLAVTRPGGKGRLASKPGVNVAAGTT